ncbi:MAG: ABC transporter permease [Clostridium sp.]
MIIFFITQMGQFEGVTKPVEGLQDYGYKYSDDTNIIMKITLQSLIGEFSRNQYVTYPIGFYKEVKLNDEKQNHIFKIIQEVTGIEEEELKIEIEQSLNNLNSKESLTLYDSLMLKNGLQFKEFSEYMNEVDELLGGGSDYNINSMNKNARVPETYEDELKVYEDIIYKDKVSGAYARLFSDYMGIVLAILPVFLAVTRVLKDKRSKSSDVIFSKKAVSTTIIISRYLATIIMILVPLLIISITPTLQSMYSASSNGVDGDLFAFVKYIFGWLMPIAMVSVSMGFFFTELTNGPIAILIQGIWWFVSISLGASNLVGNVGLNLIPRFNTLGEYDIYISVFNELVVNRLFYSFISVILIIATIFIYDMKRRGVLNINGKIFKNRKGKLEV